MFYKHIADYNTHPYDSCYDHDLSWSEMLMTFITFSLTRYYYSKASCDIINTHSEQIVPNPRFKMLFCNVLCIIMSIFIDIIMFVIGIILAIITITIVVILLTIFIISNIWCCCIPLIIILYLRRFENFMSH